VELARRRRAPVRLAAALTAASAVAGLATASALPPGPQPTRIRCERACGGLRVAIPGSLVRWTGAHLSNVVAVDFPVAGDGRASAAPVRAARQSLKAIVPTGERVEGGRPTLRSADGRRAAAPGRLRIVSRSRIPAPGSFRLLDAGVAPRPAFFDAPARLHYRFRSRGRAAVAVTVVRARRGETVRRWVRRRVTPYARHTLRWNGTAGGGRLRSGRYVVRVGRPGERAGPGSRFRLYDAEFPVRGAHGYGGPVQRFGAPRSGGRVHQGQDVLAACGTKEVAAVGGHVQARGYDPVLYGNWLVIDGRGTSTDYRYVHLLAPTPLHTGERVNTGAPVGRVGRTGNARTVGCMLHLEVWPSGWLHRSPIDPLPLLRRWDRYS
jgi:peptidase M23-like protein